MTTKVQKKYDGAIPQWLIDGGVEVFSHDGKTFLMIDNARVLFDNAPAEYRKFFEDVFQNDKQGRYYIRTVFGITQTDEAFNRWLFCKFGGIDKASDLLGEELIPDAYNNVCTSTNCPLRGKLCGTSSHLSSSDINTLKVLEEGKTIKEAALRLYLSVPGLKSRITTLREKTGARNMAQLISGYAGLSM